MAAKTLQDVIRAAMASVTLSSSWAFHSRAKPPEFNLSHIKRVFLI